MTVLAFGFEKEKSVIDELQSNASLYRGSDQVKIREFPSFLCMIVDSIRKKIDRSTPVSFNTVASCCIDLGLPDVFDITKNIASVDLSESESAEALYDAVRSYRILPPNLGWTVRTQNIYLPSWLKAKVGDLSYDTGIPVSTLCTVCLMFCVEGESFLPFRARVEGSLREFEKSLRTREKFVSMINKRLDAD